MFYPEFQRQSKYLLVLIISTVVQIISTAYSIISNMVENIQNRGENHLLIPQALNRLVLPPTMTRG